MSDLQYTKGEVETFVRRWTEAGFGQIEEQLTKLVLAAVEFDLEASRDEAIDVGETKLGGRPDLRDPTLWPRTKDGRAIGFAAQINLKQMAEFRLGSDLPRDGLLSFFVDVEEYNDFMEERVHHCLSGKHEEADQWRVLYESDPTSLARAEFPADLSGKARCGVAAVVPQRILTMPDPDEPSIERLGIRETDDEHWTFFELCDERDPRGRPRFYGNAAPIQRGMKLWCQYATHGVVNFANDPRIPDLNDPRMPDINAGIDDWLHLFTLDACNDHLAACQGMEFVGDSAIYFLIRKQDLARQDFEKAWLTLQIG